MTQTRRSNKSTVGKVTGKEGERLFYSPDGTDIRVTHPDGSVAIVGDTSRTLPPKMWRAAARAGCMVEQAGQKRGLSARDLQRSVEGEPGAGADAFKREEAIKQAMRDALEAEEDAPGFEEAFTDAEIPSVKWLESRLGFGVSGDERDALWEIVKNEYADEDDESEEEAE